MKFLAVKEAIVVGIITIVIGSVSAYLVKIILPKPKNIDNWNQYHIMEICLFLTGFLAHILFELLKINTWYCYHGAACR